MPHPLIAKVNPPQFWVTWVLLTVRTEGDVAPPIPCSPYSFPPGPLHSGVDSGFALLS